MSALFSILRAAHCRSTHHYFALDALPLIQTDAGKRLVGLLLQHHDRYLIGAKDPDTRFRDFQNHVVHVADGYWGGAPRVAHQWYDRIQHYLRNHRFSDAAHAAGVLSHYFTDPMQPLHTQQCDREKILHRPIEWSITQSYDAIFRSWQEDEMRIVFQLSEGPGWLGEAVLHGARFANRRYSPLLDQYDLERAANDPAAGLNAKLRASFAELFGLAITGWARVLERAAADAEASSGNALPDTSLVIPTILATIRIPARLWMRRIEFKEEQRAVLQLVDEFRRTGALNVNVPVEVDIVHRVVGVHQDERRWKREREQRLASKRTRVKSHQQAEPSRVAENQSPATIPFVPRIARQAGLSHSDALIDAPSIGPKTAARLTAIEIHTVGEFLAASAQALASRLDTCWLTVATVSQWQSQATLMCEVPGLNCRDAQLLAGAGNHTAAQVAACDAVTLYGKVSRFAATTAGRRYLCGAAPPSLADVTAWISDAKGETAARRPIRRRA